MRTIPAETGNGTLKLVLTYIYFPLWENVLFLTKKTRTLQSAKQIFLQNLIRSYKEIYSHFFASWTVSAHREN